MATRGPAGTVGEEVAASDGEVVIGGEEADGGSDDAVTVGIGVVAEGDLVFVLECDETGHGVGGGAVHADLAVVIDAVHASGT